MQDLENKLYKLCIDRAKKLGVKVLLSFSDSVYSEQENIWCSGYFTDKTEPPLLAVATKRNDHFLILLHESQHIEQWVENKDFWNSANEAWDFIKKWLEGEDIECIEEKINTAQLLEIDCEKRAVAVLKNLGCPEEEIKKYIKKANSYLMYYPKMKKSRKWYSFPPYDDLKCVENMPDMFLRDDEYKS
jgi:hypothetical protein